ncbi:efflux RND transporter periplasmic adaptor subunit [Alkalihalobacillus trypoxylicola]|uniref:ABC transporter n=1 Tax=Alkalihalobacillus trypoxylicola TaxID=519424 RepID=A0A161P8E1_9BACI|nr:efflux RND transporter periplasmic adaptor subunit [Alkalihalobacillus trypoxylicola]KYG27613.1 ABC transporter [Alkalihalobacillus trypoxylicola]
MTKKKVGLIITLSVAGFLALVGAGVALYLALGQDGASQGVDGWVDEPYAMSVADMTMGFDIFSPYAYSGKIEPESSERIFYEADKGTIKEVFVQEGDKVEEGTPLFEYEPLDDHELELDQLKMQLEMSYMQINRTQKQKEKLEKQIKEAESKEEKEVYEEELEQINYDLRVSNLEAGQTQKQIDALSTDDEDYVVVSKNAGIIQKIDQDIIDGIQNEQMSQGPMIQIVSTDFLIIKSQVNEFLLDTLEAGSQVRIMKKNGDGEEWYGEITEVGSLPVGFEEDNGMMTDMYFDGGSNPQSSNYPFTVKIDEHEGLEIGFHVNIELFSEDEVTDSEYVQIFDWFVGYDEEEPYVWKVDEENKVFKQVVVLGETNIETGLAEVLEGVSFEDYLVEPSYELEEGSEVLMHDDFFEEY